MKKTYLLMITVLLAQLAFGQGKFFGGAGQGYSCAQVRDTLLCAASSGTANLVGCDSVEANGQTFLSTGTYLQTLTNANGCDSNLTLLVTVNSVDTSLTVGTTTITANGSGSYQWLDCDNAFAPITGANGQVFTPPINGNYAVAIDNNGCMDTSACITMVVTGIDDHLGSHWSIAPNPADGKVILRASGDLEASEIRLMDGLGRVVQHWQAGGGKEQVLDIHAPAGVYFFQVLEGDSAVRTIKLLVR